jgi:ketosteroid isomerase-like protein
MRAWIGGAALAAALAAAGAAGANEAEDRAAVAALDTKYQAAVERNDADAMAAILHERFVLVLGDGRTLSRKDLLESARSQDVHYERQVEDPGTQTVRVWGDTAVVTARLWLKGTNQGKPFERKLWFSDTYVRTPDGWRYAFGQASLSLPVVASSEAPRGSDRLGQTVP